MAEALQSRRSADARGEKLAGGEENRSGAVLSTQNQLLLDRSGVPNPNRAIDDGEVDVQEARIDRNAIVNDTIGERSEPERSGDCRFVEESSAESAGEGE